MKTTLKWKAVKPAFQEIERPDRGDFDIWEHWFEHAWSYISDAGLANIDVPLDETKIRLRAFALCWLVHDFCSTISGDEILVCPFWDEWLDELKINPLWALLAITEEQTIGSGLSDSEIYQTDAWEGNEEGIYLDREELEHEVKGLVGALAAYRFRESIVAALVKGFGGYSGLFASLYANCGDYDNMIDYRKEVLEEELNQLRMQLEIETDENGVQHLQAEIANVREALTTEALREAIRQELTDAALTDLVYIGDEESGARLDGLKWCEENCPVKVTGHPAFHGTR